MAGDFSLSDADENFRVSKTEMSQGRMDVLQGVLAGLMSKQKHFVAISTFDQILFAVDEPRHF